MSENTTNNHQKQIIIQTSFLGNQQQYKNALTAINIQKEHHDNNHQFNQSHQHSNEHYYHIADQMLRQLQQQYEQVHRHDKKNNQNLQKGQQAGQDDKDEAPDGYQNLDIDNQFQDININSDEDQQSQQEKKQIIPSQINIFIPSQTKTINPENVQLVQVPPTPNSIFEVSKSEEEKQKQEINGNDFEKIKQLSLSMNIQTPEWALDPVKLENRVRQLFGKSSKMNSILKQ